MLARGAFVLDHGLDMGEVLDLRALVVIEWMAGEYLISRSGKAVMSKIVSLVRKSISAMPGIFGGRERAPVAIKAFLKGNRGSSSVSTV